MILDKNEKHCVTKSNNLYLIFQFLLRSQNVACFSWENNSVNSYGSSQG